MRCLGERPRYRARNRQRPLADCPGRLAYVSSGGSETVDSSVLVRDDSFARGRDSCSRNSMALCWYPHNLVLGPNIDDHCSPPLNSRSESSLKKSGIASLSKRLTRVPMARHDRLTSNASLRPRLAVGLTSRLTVEARHGEDLSVWTVASLTVDANSTRGRVGVVPLLQSNEG